MKAKQIIYKAIAPILTLTLLVIACDKMDPEPQEGKGSFTTGAQATLTVNAARDITSTSATIDIKIVNTGGRKISRLILCYSATSLNPYLSDQIIELGEVYVNENNKTVTAKIENLTHNNIYYFKAWAQNAFGFANSGNALNFTTKADPLLPNVTTETAYNLSMTNATLSGKIVSLGENSTVTQHGHVWATHSTPSLADSKTTFGTGSIGEFISNITSLQSNTKYFYRAYATNSKGTSYGNIKYFTTHGIPDVNTNNVTSITPFTAICQHYCNSSSPLTARGVCWSTSSNPTINDAKTVDALNNSVISSNITGLLPNTTYYVKAYATNSYGTGYGDAISFVTSDNSWTQKKDFSGVERSEAVAFAIGNKGYFGTGSNGISQTYYKDFWEYDPNADTWTQKADFGGTGRSNAVGFAIGDKGYIGTGYNGNGLKDFWEFNPTTNTWTQKADFLYPNWSCVGLCIGTKGYVGLGSPSASNIRNAFYEYNPATNAWFRMGDFPNNNGLSRTACFAIGNKGYIGTGAEFNAGDSKIFWEFSPETNTWTKKTDFGGMGRVEAFGFSINGKGYIGGGGITGTGITKDLWEYNPTNDTWLRKPDLSEGDLFGSQSFTINNKAYIVVQTNHLWEYNPAK